METESNEFQVEKIVRKDKSNFKRYFILSFVLFIFADAVFFFGFYQGKKSAQEEKCPTALSQSIVSGKTSSSSKDVDFSLFWKAWDLVKEKHIDRNSLDAREMVYGAIKGMMRATKDPYTDFMDPKETKQFNEQVDGSFEGIGAELGIKDEVLTVITPLDDSPAQKAGLLAGDKIIKIDGKISADFTIDEAVEMIRGPKGTEVKLTIFRNGNPDTQDIVIKRNVIVIKSVKLEFKDNNIAHLKVNEFGEDSLKEFNTAVNSIMLKESKGIILDLRNNPGGLLDKCVSMSSLMIPRGKVVVIEENNRGEKNNLYAKGTDRMSAIPTVVLINEGSASAAEIMAGALKENQGITLVGKKSFGKGSVQEMVSLPGKTSAKITVSKWLTPNGNYIMEKGIDPDVEVKMTAEDYENKRDPQLDKAMEILKSKL